MWGVDFCAVGDRQLLAAWRKRLTVGDGAGQRPVELAQIRHGLVHVLKLTDVQVFVFLGEVAEQQLCPLAVGHTCVIHQFLGRRRTGCYQRVLRRRVANDVAVTGVAEVSRSLLGQLLHAVQQRSAGALAQQLGQLALGVFLPRVLDVADRTVLVAAVVEHQRLWGYPVQALLLADHLVL